MNNQIESGAERPWRVVQVRPAAEFKVAEGLSQMGLVAYCPVEIVWRRSAWKASRYARPLIRGYVFAMMDEGHISVVHEVDGATRVVAFGGRPAILAPGFVAGLREAELQGRFDKTDREKKAKRGEPRHPGERVRIVSGPFKGVVAQVARLTASRRIEVMLAHLKDSRATVTIDLVDVEAAEAA